MANPQKQDAPLGYSGMWMGTQSVARHLNRKISGYEDVDWLQYVLSADIARNDPRKRCLLLQPMRAMWSAASGTGASRDHAAITKC